MLRHVSINLSICDDEDEDEVGKDLPKYRGFWRVK